MKLAVSLAVALVAIGSARADVTPPTGWRSNPQFAGVMSTRNDLFGGLPATVTTEVYRAPIDGAVLYVTRAEAKATAAQRDAAASYEVEELRRAFDRASGTKPLAQSQRVDPAAKVVEGAIHWQEAGLASIQRVVVAADADRVVALRGECVLATGVAPEIVKACEAALATLAPDIAPARRVALALVGDAAAVEAQPGQVMPPPPTAAAVTSTGPSMGDGSRLPPITPVQVAPPKGSRRETDKRPVILGFGLVVMAIVFYWNRRRRERFEREDTRAARREGRETTSDADDLHAAADAPATDDDAKKKGDDDTN